MDKLKGGNQKEKGGIRESFIQATGAIRVYDQNETFRHSSEVVADSGSDADERRRASFAPDGDVLSAEYEESGLAFFFLCRGSKQPGSQELARWIRVAQNETKQHAALSYLVQGDLSRQVAGFLKGTISGTWLGNVSHSPLMASFDPQERNLILAFLNLLPITEEGPTPEDEEEHSHVDPTTVLENIHAWWEVERGAARLGLRHACVSSRVCTQAVQGLGGYPH